jgi:hypothetical protein
MRLVDLATLGFRSEVGEDPISEPGQEPEGVDAVVGVDEENVIERRDIEDWVGSGGGSVKEGGAFNESAAVEDYYYGAERLCGLPWAGVEAEVEAVF